PPGLVLQALERLVGDPAEVAG
ncbi:hypothetical protein, partial [Pseudomonas aeruginosa]